MPSETHSSKLAIHGGAPVRTKPFPPRALFGPKEKAAVDEVLDEAIASGQAFGYGGPREQSYEKQLAEFLGGGFAKAVNSGTSAVLAAVAALELEPGSEVVCPPITDPGGVMPVAMMNCIPVPADGDGFSFNAGPDQIAAAVTERTKAIVVAHIMGEPADMPAIADLAHRRGVALIEDCAQAPGATLAGRQVGTWGDLAAFSTMSGKHFATGAQGGVVFTRREDLFWKARRFMDRGKPFGTDQTSNVALGLNLNSNELAAAIGRVQLDKLPHTIERRRAVAARIAEGIGPCRALSPGRILPQAEAVYWFMRLTVDEGSLSVSKDDFARAVAAEGIPVAASYRHMPSEHVWFRQRCTYGRSGYPWPAGGAHQTCPALPNCEAAVAANFLLSIHENWGADEVADAVAALVKVEQACLGR